MSRTVKKTPEKDRSAPARRRGLSASPLPDGAETSGEKLSVNLLNADVWSQYALDYELVQATFPGTVDKEHVPIAEGKTKSKKSEDKNLGGRQEMFDETRAAQMLMGSGEAIFAGNFWWAEVVPVSGQSVIRASAISDYRSEHRDSWPCMLEPFMLVVVEKPEQLTMALKGKWRSLGNEEIKMAVVAECAQVIRDGNMSSDAKEKWEHMFRTCAYKVKLAPENKWKYLAIDQRRELQSTSNAIARLPTQQILELGLHRDSLKNNLNTSALDSNAVASDLRRNLSVNLKDDDFGDKFVKDALAVYDRAFSQPKVLKIAIADVEKYGANAVFNQVGKHEKIVSIGKHADVIQWLYTSLFDRREHCGGMTNLGFREFAGAGAQVPGIVQLHKLQMDLHEHLLNNWLPTVEISGDEIATLRTMLASHESVRAVVNGESQAWRQNLGPGALASLEFVLSTLRQIYLIAIKQILLEHF